ncbi:MAG: hypothetical protein H6741_24060 [Alphaproteobacteria bacterium]|nr:hypothetical protein [Alphaproteobacteria bacterium]
MTLALLTLLACGGKDADTADDSGDAPPEQVWPDQQKVLFYFGMGGRSGDSSGIGGSDEAAAWLESTYVWPSNQRDTLGEPFNFRAIFFMDIGAFDGTYSDDNVSDLLDAMETGTRLIFLADRETCSGPVVNGLLTELGAPMQLSGERRTGATTIAPSGEHQVTDGVGEVYFNEPCDMETNGATPLFTESRSVYGAVYRPGYGGDIVLLGDMNFMDDSGRIDEVDNRALLGNLAEVIPGM